MPRLIALAVVAALGCASRLTAAEFPNFKVQEIATDLTIGPWDPGLQHAAEGSFQVLLDAAMEVSPKDGLQLALIGWSMSHGRSHLGIDGVFDSLPLPKEATAGLESRLTAHLFQRMGLVKVQPEPSSAAESGR